MTLGYKRVLYINLKTKEYEFKTHGDLWPYIGGIGIAYKLMLDNLEQKPIILATGSLSGKFPFISKSALLYVSKNKIFEAYGGGTMHAQMTFSNLDAIVFIDKPEENLKLNISQREVLFVSYDTNILENRNTNFLLSPNMVSSENYFSYGIEDSNPLELEKQVSVTIDSTESTDIPNYYDYEKLYGEIMENFKSLSVEPRNNPSCYGCPMGCDYSALGENNLNIAVLPRCLVACGYAEGVYKNIPLVYACFNSIGFDYRHSDFENIPGLVGDLKLNIGKILNVL